MSGKNGWMMILVKLFLTYYNMDQYLMDRLDALMAKWYELNRVIKYDTPTLVLSLNWKSIIEIAANKVRTIKYKDNWDTYVDISYDMWDKVKTFLEELDVDEFCDNVNKYLDEY